MILFGATQVLSIGKGARSTFYLQWEILEEAIFLLD